MSTGSDQLKAQTELVNDLAKQQEGTELADKDTEYKLTEQLSEQKEGQAHSRKIVCHAEGDRCFGCAHYLGKADECEFKGLEKGIAISREWVSVSDELPEERNGSGRSAQLWLYTVEGGICQGYYSHESGRWFDFVSRPVVTHWMNEPAPPELKSAIGQHTGEQP